MEEWKGDGTKRRKRRKRRRRRKRMNYGPEQLDVLALIIHCPTSLGVSEQQRAQAKQTVQSQQMKKGCEQMIEQISKWPSS